jgi:hypothetical protein
MIIENIKLQKAMLPLWIIIGKNHTIALQKRRRRINTALKSSIQETIPNQKTARKTAAFNEKLCA